MGGRGYTLALLTLVVLCGSGCSTMNDLQVKESQIANEAKNETTNTLEGLEFRPDTPEVRNFLRGRPGMVPKGQTGQGTNTRTDNIEYHESYDGQIVEEISRELQNLPNVDDVRVILHERTVLVGILTYEEHKKQVEKEVRNRIQQKLGKQDIRIVFDKEQFKKVDEMDRQLRSGAPFYEVGPRYNQFFSDIGRILQRPFEHSRDIEGR